jgi:hypothetical protein
MMCHAMLAARTCLLLAVSPVLITGCETSKPASVQDVPASQRADDSVLLEVGTVRLPEVVDYRFMRNAGPGSECPLLDHFHNFFWFDWSRELLISDFAGHVPGAPTYSLLLQSGRVRKIWQYFGSGSYFRENIYEIDVKGRLVRVLQLYDRDAFSYPEPPVREIRVEYKTESRCPSRLIIAGDPCLPRGEVISVLYEYEHAADGFSRVVARESRDASGELTAYLRGYRAAREVLHYSSPESIHPALSDLFDAEGKPVMHNEQTVHVSWDKAPLWEYVGPDGKLFEEEEE